MNKVAVIFGGTGFIGAFFAEFLVEKHSFDKVYVIDSEEPQKKNHPYRQAQLSKKGIIYRYADVRDNLSNLSISESIDLVANFAAVHREPGHELSEYYETNIRGAENVCQWASEVGCKRIIFTSSISVYGSSLIPRSEKNTPAPSSAYGGSKLAAEIIHEKWLAEDSDNRKLIILRPGVVFGPGELGNVSRLIHGVSRGYFVYTGNRKLRKAGIYIKELCNIAAWTISISESKNPLIICNCTMDPGPSMQDYVGAISHANGKKYSPFNVPFLLISIVASILAFFMDIIKINHPFNKKRIDKLLTKNDIQPHFIRENGYEYQYSLEEAFKDWSETDKSDWM